MQNNGNDKVRVQLTPQEIEMLRNLVIRRLRSLVVLKKEDAVLGSLLYKLSRARDRLETLSESHLVPT